MILYLFISSLSNRDEDLVNKIKIIHWNCFKLNQNKCQEKENFLIDNSPDIDVYKRSKTR